MSRFYARCVIKSLLLFLTWLLFHTSLQDTVFYQPFKQKQKEPHPYIDNHENIKKSTQQMIFLKLLGVTRYFSKFMNFVFNNDAPPAFLVKRLRKHHHWSKRAIKLQKANKNSHRSKPLICRNTSFPQWLAALVYWHFCLLNCRIANTRWEWRELKRLKLGSTIHFSSFNWREGGMAGKWGIFHGPMEFSKKKSDLWG